MYEVIRPAYEVHGPGVGEKRTVPEERRTFPTAAHVLRWAIDEDVFDRWGRRGKPEHFGDPYLGRYAVFDSFCRWRITPELKAAMIKAQTRFNEIMYYLHEVEPEWRPDVERTGNAAGHLCFADNSTELHEINKYGQRRHSYVTAPHGDACF